MFIFSKFQKTTPSPRPPPPPKPPKPPKKSQPPPSYSFPVFPFKNPFANLMSPFKSLFNPKPNPDTKPKPKRPPPTRAPQSASPRPTTKRPLTSPRPFPRKRPSVPQLPKRRSSPSRPPFTMPVLPPPGNFPSFKKRPSLKRPTPKFPKQFRVPVPSYKPGIIVRGKGSTGVTPTPLNKLYSTTKAPQYISSPSPTRRRRRKKRPEEKFQASQPLQNSILSSRPNGFFANQTSQDTGKQCITFLFSSKSYFSFQASSFNTWPKRIGLRRPVRGPQRGHHSASGPQRTPGSISPFQQAFMTQNRQYKNKGRPRLTSYMKEVNRRLDTTPITPTDCNLFSVCN